MLPCKIMAGEGASERLLHVEFHILAKLRLPAGAYGHIHAL